MVRGWIGAEPGAVCLARGVVRPSGVGRERGLLDGTGLGSVEAGRSWPLRTSESTDACHVDGWGVGGWEVWSGGGGEQGGGVIRVGCGRGSRGGVVG